MQPIHNDKAISAFESRHVDDNSIRAIDGIKEAASNLFRKIASIPGDSPEALRLKSLAHTELEACVMWATKAVSRS